MAIKTKVVKNGDVKNLALKQQVTLFAKGITCISCVYRIEGELLRVDGVVNVSVDLANEKVIVDYLPNKAAIDQLIAAVNNVGYEASIDQRIDAEAEIHKRQKEREQEYQKQKNKFWLSVLLTSFFILEIVSDLGIKYGFFSGFAFSLSPLTQFLLATPIQFYVGAHFYKGAYKALQNGSVNKDLLVALGTSVVYLYSLIQSVVDVSGNLYYEVNVILITLIQLGQLLQAGRPLRTSID